jgi:hypothetical protein
MDYDFYTLGFGKGVWINGSHWYADPFYLYSDYTIDHAPLSVLGAPDLQTVSAILYEQQTMYFLRNILSEQPDPTPVPVPEPSAIALLVCCVAVVFIYKQIKCLTRSFKRQVVLKVSDSNKKQQH